MTGPGEKLRLLLVDDDPDVRRAYAANLTRRGAEVEVAENGRAAVERMKDREYDAIVSDISMPEMTGIQFLRAVRAHDLEVPVILMTGQPDMESAIRAVEFGAFHYLVKPVAGGALWTVAVRAARLHGLAKLKSEALRLTGKDRWRLGDRAALEVRFLRGMERLWVAFQPIVHWPERRVYGYEALVRSDERVLQTPAAILDAAERLGRVHELGRVVRAKAAEAARTVGLSGARLFVNLHSAELNDDALYSAEAELSSIAGQVVLEVTERASLDDVKDVATRVARLKSLGFRIAVDDLGSGYAGLTSFTQLEPEIVKLDMTLVRGVDTDPARQAIIRSMSSLCGQLDIQVIAEGVETTGERDMLSDLGCTLFQGFLFAKPGPAFPAPQW